MTIDPSRLATCRGCGKKVMFITTNEGKRVPLDPVAPVFTRVWDPETDKVFWVQDTTEQAFVSHFATCPKANDFSGRGRNRLTPR